MKKKDIMILNNVLAGLNIENANVKFKYLVSKNKITLKTEVEMLQELINDSSKDFKVYDQQSMALVSEFGVKDEEGNVVQLSNNAVRIIPEKLEEFKSKLEKLQKDNKKLIDIENARMTEVETFMEEEVQGVTIERFPLGILPDEISQEIMDVLFNYIDEA